MPKQTKSHRGGSCPVHSIAAVRRRSNSMDFVVDNEEVESRVRSLAPIVRRIAKHMAASMPSAIDEDHLVQSGMMSLVDAAKRFHGSAGAEFDAYAVPRIRGEMIQALEGCTSLPSDIRRRMREAELAIERLEKQKGRPPSELEVANAVGIPLDEYLALLRAAQGYQIVSYADRSTSGSSPAGQQDGDDDPLQIVNDPSTRGAVVAAIDKLPERERLVMSLYHEHQLNHAEIGAVIGVSEARVSELYTHAIARIRVAIRQR